MQMNALEEKTVPRAEDIAAFLERSGWGGAVIRPLAGDASFRKYFRLHRGSDRAVLMDAPPAKESVASFIKIAAYLHEAGYSAPRLLATSEREGLLLLEDLGDDLYTAVLGGRLALSGTVTEQAMYDAAVDVLVDWQARAERQNAALPLPHYGREPLLNEASLFADWYLPQVAGAAEAQRLCEEYLDLWRTLLEKAAPACRQFVHRDFHVDNLLWLPERKGAKRVGLLDFQDALFGHPAYDLVSLLEDARRDVPAAVAEGAYARYLRQTDCDAEEFGLAYALLGAQRNSKIIGIFVRLAVRDGKSLYLPFLPRVWRHLERDVAHPALRPLADWLNRHIPVSWRGEITVPRPSAAHG